MQLSAIMYFTFLRPIHTNDIYVSEQHTRTTKVQHYPRDIFYATYENELRRTSIRFL